MYDVDQAILDRLDGCGVTIHPGWFNARPPAEPDGPVVVDIPLPYANYLSSFGDDSEPRLSGRNAQREKFFRLFHVGITLEQVHGAIGKTRARLEGHRLTFAGANVGRIQVDSSPLVFRDDGAVRPDGKPLFVGVDNYTLRFSIRRS